MSRNIAVIIFVLVNCCNLSAATYWISPKGHSSGTGSETNPFASAEAALRNAGGGHTFIFQPGDYVGGQITLLPEVAGTAQEPTVLKSQYKHKAVLHGSTFHNIYVKAGCSWVIIDGFESSGAKYTGIKSGADYTVIRNCRIHNNALHGIEAHDVYGTVIENNVVEYNGAHLHFSHGIYADGDGLTIRNNIIRFNSGWGLHLYPEIANSKIESNLIHGNSRWGIGLYSRLTAGSNTIVNNTIVLNGSGIAVNNAHHELIANNIIVDNTAWVFEITEPIQCLAGDFSSSTIDYNLCYPPFEGLGPNGISAEPLFLDAAKGTFYLNEGSPAIGMGSIEYAPKQDFFNRPLLEEIAPDLGCFPYEPALLQPQARRDWYCQWPFLFRVRPDDTLPDFWKLPVSGHEGVD